MADIKSEKLYSDAQRPLDGSFLAQIQRWLNDVDAMMHELDKGIKWEIYDHDWMRKALIVASTEFTVVMGCKAIAAVAGFPYPGALMAFGGTAVVLIALGILLHRLHKASVTSYLEKTRVMVEETFFYLKDRLVGLNDVDKALQACVKELKEKNAKHEESKVDLLLFKEAVRLCDLDVNACLVKLHKLRPVVDECIGQLEQSLEQNYRIEIIELLVAFIYMVSSYIFGKYDVDFAALKNHLDAFQARCSSISTNLTLFIDRLDSHVKAVKDL